jgi:polysaccharide export outer membrane protein
LQVLQGNIDTSRYAQLKIPEQKVQKGDQLIITVFSDNPAASAMFNSGGVSESMNSSSGMLTAAPNSPSSHVYEVDDEGMIHFPQLGRLKLDGLTKKEIIALLNSKLKDKFLSNPYYSIQFINLKITVFGDVNKPGVYPLSRPDFNIFEALTVAGDLTYYGKRENILVIREVNGRRIFGRIDITRPDVFNSPFFYLQQNDMVFVDMRKGKVNGTDQAWLRNASLLLSLLTTVTILVNIFR